MSNPNNPLPTHNQLAETPVTVNNSIPIRKFRDMDYLSVEKFKLSIELLMENAGLNLARLAASFVSKSDPILIGIGTGNNGGGGLVAARRLAGWGFRVFLHLPNAGLKPLPKQQLERALATGAREGIMNQPKLFIDAYLGFSQRLPLAQELKTAISKANQLSCKKISLDLPTGFDRETGTSLFKPDIILTLAAMKTELIPLLAHTEIYIADLGLPAAVYKQFGIKQAAEFGKQGIIKCISRVL